jgi:hypothetical protein
MRTIKQALIDEIAFPIGEGSIENKLLRRGLDADAEITADVLNSSAFIGATADCLYSLIDTPNFSEANKSVSLSDKDLILKKANALYSSIGEEEKTISKPTVYIL